MEIQLQGGECINRAGLSTSTLQLEKREKSASQKTSQNGRNGWWSYKSTVSGTAFNRVWRRFCCCRNYDFLITWGLDNGFEPLRQQVSMACPLCVCSRLPGPVCQVHERHTLRGKYYAQVQGDNQGLHMFIQKKRLLKHVGPSFEFKVLKNIRGLC